MAPRSRSDTTAIALAAPPPRPVARSIEAASYLLMAAALLLIMWRGLLPGLLCVCLGFLLTRAFSSWFARLLRAPSHAAATPRSAQVAAAALVMLSPLVLLAVGLTQSRSYVIELPQ